MSEQFPMALAEGTILAGEFVVERPLGQGGFGITYLAHNHKTNEKVVIKEFYPDSMASRSNDTQVIPFSGERGEHFEYGKGTFLQEAETLAQFIGNPNIVKIYSYFEENGTAYFVMEYVEGISLDRYIKNKGGRLSYEETEQYLVPVMDALAAVHKKGIIHRDVTPDNIYIASDGTVKLLDFGAARYSLGDKSRSLDVVLKHGFAPKEQYTRHGRQGPFTDVYALAASFYFCMTGKKPQDSIDRMDEDELIPPSTLGANISGNKEDVILKALAVQPRDRFQTMDEFRAALTGQRVVQPTPVENVKVFSQPAPQPQPAPQQPQPVPQQPQPVPQQGEATVVAMPGQIPHTGAQPYNAGHASQIPPTGAQPYNAGHASQIPPTGAQPYNAGQASQIPHTGAQPYNAGQASQIPPTGAQPYNAGQASQIPNTGSQPGKAPQPKAAPGKTKKKSKLPMILGIVGAVVVLFALIGSMGGSSRSSSRPDPSSSSSNNGSHIQAQIPSVDNDDDVSAQVADEPAPENPIGSDVADAPAEDFKFANQTYITFKGDFFKMNYNLFGMSYDEVNEIFGGKLPATESVDWWYSDFGEYYDWTEYKEAGGNLEDHGINFFFEDDELVWVGYDKALSSFDDVVKDAKNTLGPYGGYAEDSYGNITMYMWNVTDEVAYDIHTYSSTEGTMYSQRYGIWSW